MELRLVRDWLTRTPFVPLLVRMVSGQTYRVTTPESIVASRYVAFLVESGIIAVVAREFIEEIRPLKNGARNGSKRKRKRRGRG